MSIKIVLEHLTPVEMIAARLLLASITLFAVIKARRLSWRMTATWPGILIMSAIVFLHFWVMATGMLQVSASHTAWILTTAPIFIALLSWVYLREPLNGWQWLGLAVACGGVLALSYNGDARNLSWSSSQSELIVLGSCVTWALYTVGTRKVTRGMDALVATFWMCLPAAIVFVPLILIKSGTQVFSRLSPWSGAHLLFLGIFCLALAFWFWSEGLKRQPAAEVGVYLYVEPLITVIAAWWLLGEPMTLWLLVGAVFISLGVWLTESYGKKPGGRQT